MAAMDFHWGKRAELSGEFVGFEVAGLLGSLAFEKFGCHGCDGNGGLTSEGLKGSTVDDFFSVFFGELKPHPEHVSAVGRTDGSHAVGILHFTDILRRGEGVAGFVFEIVAHGQKLIEVPRKSSWR